LSFPRRLRFLTDRRQAASARAKIQIRTLPEGADVQRVSSNSIPSFSPLCPRCNKEMAFPPLRIDGADAAKSLGSGLVNGTGMLVGLPGDVRGNDRGLHDRYIRPIEQKLAIRARRRRCSRWIEEQRPTVLPTSGHFRRLLRRWWASLMSRKLILAKWLIRSAESPPFAVVCPTHGR
jgi:hypothetical protein